MPFQTASNVEVLIAQQAGRGTIASAGGTSYYLPINPGSGLTLTKAKIDSNAIRRDGQRAIHRHGSKSGGGSYEMDLGLQHPNLLIMGAMKGTWATVAAFGTNGTIAGTASNGKFIFGSGSVTALGLREGMVVRLSGITGSGTANNSKNLRVSAVDGTSFTTPDTIVNFGPSQDTIVTVAGRYIVNGTTERYFTVEEREGDIDASIVFSDNKVGSVSLQIQPDQMVKITANLMGRTAGTYTGTDSPYFTAGTAFTGLGLVASDITLRLNGTDIADLTGVNFTIEPGAQGQPVVGSNTQADIFTGLSKVSGQLTGIRSDFAKLGNFIAEDTISLHILMVENESEPKSFHSVYIGQLKLDTNGKSFAQQGPLIETIDFAAGIDQRGTAAGVAATTVLWQSDGTTP